MARVRVAKAFRTDAGPRRFSKKLLDEQKALLAANTRASQAMHDATAKLAAFRSCGMSIQEALKELRKKHRPLWNAYQDAIRHLGGNDQRKGGKTDGTTVRK